jgi:spore germination protein GerM
VARRGRTARPALAALAAVFVALLVAGCVSMPTGGPVRAYPVTQAANAQSQPFVQVVPQRPRANWSPTDIVEGFLTASASFGNYSQIAAAYLTPQLQKAWNRDPSWSAIVYSTGPTPTGLAYQPAAAKSPTTATVQIAGTPQATLQGSGNYSVASTSSGNSSTPQPSFTLTKVNNQWRISAMPTERLLTSNSFQNDYQLSNLYFFDPAERYLVPDPVYVPLQAQPSNLINGLVHDLNSPPDDWLSGGATKTAFPKGTKISGATLDGATAVVDLAGTAITKAASQPNSKVMEQVSAQLLYTLREGNQGESTGQGVQSVEVVVNGKAWTPAGSQNNPVQQKSKLTPASGDSQQFYYVTSAGDLTSRTATSAKPATVAKIGTGFTQIAVSPDGRYVAALRGTTLSTGLVGGTLTRRPGSFVSVSWDHNDNLWAAQGEQIVEFRNTGNSRVPLDLMVGVEVNVPPDEIDVKNPADQYTALQVAPDGVRVAIIMGGTTLTFGAISGATGPTPLIALSLVQLSPDNNASEFTGLTWYGPNDVITLATPGPAVTEYAVSGGAAQSIPAYPAMKTITAGGVSQPLIAGLPNGSMVYDASLTGSWLPLTGSGISPMYPG